MKENKKINRKIIVDLSDYHLESIHNDNLKVMEKRKKKSMRKKKWYVTMKILKVN